MGAAASWAGAGLALLALGPASLVGGLGGLFASALTGPDREKIRKKARKIAAVDGFPISDSYWALITRASFWIVDGTYSAEIPFADLIEVELASDRTTQPSLLQNASAAIRLTYGSDMAASLRDIFKRRRPKRQITEEYVLSGPNSLIMAQLAVERLREYARLANMSTHS